MNFHILINAGGTFSYSNGIIDDGIEVCMTLTKHEKSCGAVILRRRDEKPQVLLIRQKQGHWCFPKGHVEGSETEHETAVREVREETGYEISFIDGFRAKTTYSPKANTEKEVVYFLASENGGSPHVQEEEVSEMRWVSLIDAGALMTYDNDAEILRRAVSFIRHMEPEE